MARPLPTVQIRYDGAWNTVTRDVYSTESIRISRGRRSWASVADPAEATIPFKQSDSVYAPGTVGRYAPRNPTSDLFGKIGRNTPIRIRLGDAAPRLHFPSLDAQVASTPDTASLRLTGDQRVEVLIDPITWRAEGGAGLARRYDTSIAAGRAFAFYMFQDGRLNYRISADGSVGLDRTSTVAVTDTNDPLWLAVWLDANNGAAGHTVGFETSTNGTTWTALGANVVTAGTFTMNAAQAVLELGRVFDTGTGGIGIRPFAGGVLAFRYRSGILSSSTIVASADFTTLDTDATGFTDPQGHVWTITPPAYITDPSIRFAGEAAAWPQSWDLSGNRRSATVTAAGALRRAQKTITPLRSSLRRDLSTKANVVAYWPMEETAGSRFASALAGDNTFLTATDDGQLKAAASTDFVASEPLPTLGSTDVFGQFPLYASPNNAQRFVFLARIPDDGIAADRNLCRLTTSGTAARWELRYATGGGLRTGCYELGGATIFEDGPFAGSMNGSEVMLSLWLEQQGADLFYQFARFPLTGGAVVVDEGTLANRTFGRFTSVLFGSVAGMDQTAFGHAALLNGDVHNIWDTAGNSLQAWAGESGSDRLSRLGTDEEFPVRFTGTAVNTPAMGPQRTRTLVELQREVEATDLGILTDADDAAGAFAYRAAASMMADPVLTLPYTMIGEGFQPVDDDQGTVNRVTTKSPNGLEFTVEDTTSSMSTQPPPAGVGLYDQSADINADTAPDAEANAWWRLALGTIDGSRWPSVRLYLDRADVAAIADEVLAVTFGDIIRITDLPQGVPPGPIDLMVDAVADDITRAQHIVEFTVSPAGPWGQTGVWANSTGAPAGVARWDTSNTRRAAGTVTTTQTTITLQINDGKAWTTDAADFPFDIMFGGERMTVTSIGAPSGSGMTFTQAFVVTRSVNGVVKTHPTGTTAALAEPTVWAK